MNEPSNTDSSGEIEPNPEVIFGDDNEETSRKRARATGSSEGPFEKLVAVDMGKEFREKKIDESIKNIRNATLEISDYTIQEVGKLEANIQKIEMENLKMNAKMGQQGEQMVKMQKENLQNEIENQKLKEYILKMKEDNESHSKSADLKINELEGKVLKQEKLLEEHEKSTKKLIEGFQKSLDEIQMKMIDQNHKSSEHENSIRKLIEEKSKEKLEEMEKGSTQVKAQSSRIQSRPTQPRARSRNILSDNCNLTMTAAEQEYLDKCIFCKSEDHKSIQCRKIRTGLERRRTIFYKQKRCLKCLDVYQSMDSHSCPRANVICSICRWSTRFSLPEHFHHPILCDLNDQDEDIRYRRQMNNGDRQFDGLPPLFNI